MNKTKITMLPTALILLLYLLAPIPAEAVPISHVYQTTVPVSSKSAAEREQAIQIAFKQVFSKATGLPVAADNPVIAKALKTAKDYVRSYRYMDNLNEVEKIQNPWVLKVDFMPIMFEKLLEQASIPAWPANRPLLLVWIAQDSEQGRQLIGADKSASPIVDTLRHLENNRGLPLILPALDLIDVNQVSFTDVWAPFIPQIEKASARYQSDAILILRLTQTPKEGWMSQWTLLLPTEHLTIQLKGLLQKDILVQGINWVIVTLRTPLIKKTQVESKENTSVLITVSGITHPSDFSKIKAYLQTLPIVKQCELANVASAALEYRLTLNGSIEDFQASIKPGGKLQLLTKLGDEADDDVGLPPDSLYYQWHG